jgi:hypothetical protein
MIQFSSIADWVASKYGLFSLHDMAHTHERAMETPWICALCKRDSVIAFRPQTQHIRGGWSHYTDTSEPVDGKGAQNMVTVQSRF